MEKAFRITMKIYGSLAIFSGLGIMVSMALESNLSLPTLSYFGVGIVAIVLSVWYWANNKVRNGYTPQEMVLN